MIVHLPWDDQHPTAEFVIPGEPASKSRARFTKRGSKVATYTPAKTLEAERRVAAAYLTVARKGTDADQAFGVVMEFLQGTGQRRDVDNMTKLILDGLNTIAWPDDSQVVAIQATKRRVPPGEALTRVRIYDAGQIERPKGKCEHCGGEFLYYPSQKARRFCTQDCHRAWRQANRTRVCALCGSTFDHAHPGGEQVYCSIQCSSRAKHVAVTCAACGTSFTKARSLNRSGNSYCSAECKATYWREQRKSAAKGTCQDCGGPTTRASYKRCRDCAFAAGGRWADRDPASVTCSICHRFNADDETCPCLLEETPA